MLPRLYPALSRGIPFAALLIATCCRSLPACVIPRSFLRCCYVHSTLLMGSRCPSLASMGCALFIRPLRGGPPLCLLASCDIRVPFRPNNDMLLGLQLELRLLSTETFFYRKFPVKSRVSLLRDVSVRVFISQYFARR